jgi:PP-loop superfamily ATP-utilizing enzyme
MHTHQEQYGFMFVTVDMQGYRLGSMNATLKLNGEKA